MSDRHECKYCDGIHPCAADDTIFDDFGRSAERADIVAWLRGNDVVETGGAFADFIERGEHLKNPVDSLHVPTTCKEGLHND